MAVLNHSLSSKKIMFNYPSSSALILKILDVLISEGLIEGYTQSKPPVSFKKTQKRFFLKNRQGLTVFFRLQRGRYNPLRFVQTVSVPS